MNGSQELTLEQATKLYRSVDEEHARVFLDFLIAHPDDTIDSESIQRVLSMAAHKQVALSAYAVGQVAESLGLPRPWTEGQKGYTMTAATAGLFDQARTPADAAN